MDTDSPTDDAHAEPAGITAEPHDRDESRDTSVVNTDVQTQSQSSGGDVHERWNFELAAQSSEHGQVSETDDDEHRPHISHAGASTTTPNKAWVKRRKQPHEYRHLVTGAIYRNSNSPPLSTGPTAQDIPDGWKAKLTNSGSEEWTYEHIATRLVHANPACLSEDTVEAIKIAASHGELPRFCQACLEHGRIKYKITSSNGPEKWRASKHPRLIENEMQAFLTTYEARSRRPAKATLLTKGGQHLPISPESFNLTEEVGTLLIEDIDQAWINFLNSIVHEIYSTQLPFFIFGHIAFDEIRESDAMKNLAQQVKGRYWMSREDDSRSPSQCDVIFDEEGGKLHFASPSYLAMNMLEDVKAVRISTFPLSEQLSKCPLRIYCQ
jgi:plasmid stability protein